MIEIRDLSIHYSDTPAITGVNLNIAPNEITAIVGPSGCGKSSLLHSINRMTDLIPGCNVSGSISIMGRNISNGQIDPRELRRNVGLIFQKPNPFPLTVRANLHLALKEHGVRSKSERDAIAESALREMGLWDEVRGRLDGPALALSGGQQQRLCIARAVALRPEVLLMDEPCSALDPLSTEKIEEYITEKLRGSMTVVIVTHNLAQARRISDRVAVLWIRNDSGCLIESGSASALFENPREEETRRYFKGLRG